MSGPSGPRGLTALLLAAASACFLVGAAITVTDVAARALFARNVPAAIETTTFAIGLGALISMPICYALREHVTAKLLSELMPNRMARPLGLFGALVSAAFAGVMAWIMGSYAIEKWTSPETSPDTGLPMWLLMLIVAVAVVAAFLAALAGLRRPRHG